MRSNQARAYAHGLLAVFLWSTVATAFKLSLEYAHPLQLLAYAALTSTIVLGAYLILTGRTVGITSRPPRLFALSLLQGFLNPFLYYAILFKAYALLPAQIAQPLNYTWAFTLSALSAVFLKQKIYKRDVVSGLVCYLGVAVLLTGGRFDTFTSFDPLGVFLALASTVVWSVSWILNTRDPRDVVESLFLSFASSLPFTAIACAWVAPPVPDVRAVAGGVYVGLFEMGITFVLWLKALRLSENAAKMANLIFISPFISFMFIHSIVGEPIRASSVAGLVIIVCGLSLQRPRSRDKGRRDGYGARQPPSCPSSS
ncbi:MAG TPA: DMT family transporter [Deltaproteobacteria bacterium]|nr:DMT family transporter [Deltaproteobacteria bacterium]HOM29517.1 DMT family transporter [Deltaproteobacteria bacterium]HPP81442.1 DMT family transporter [Deltaproteobacteria bacterium]